MVQKILCATDGSRVSDKAVEYAVHMAKETGVELTVLTINTVSADSAAKTYFWDSEILDAADAQIRQEMKAAQAVAEKVGLTNVKFATAYGRDVAKAIVEYADKNGHDHLVVGSHGHSGVKRLVLGSTAGEVVAAAHCPVTVVR